MVFKKEKNNKNRQLNNSFLPLIVPERCQKQVPDITCQKSLWAVWSNKEKTLSRPCVIRLTHSTGTYNPLSISVSLSPSFSPFSLLWQHVLLQAEQRVSTYENWVMEQEVGNEPINNEERWTTFIENTHPYTHTHTTSMACPGACTATRTT